MASDRRIARGYLQSTDMFCRECRSLAYGSKCHICGRPTIPLEQTWSKDTNASQGERVARIRRIDFCCILAMTFAVFIVGLGAAGMSFGRAGNSAISTLIVVTALAVAQLFEKGVQVESLDWKRLAIALAFVLFALGMLWMGLGLLAIFVLPIWLWFRLRAQPENPLAWWLPVEKSTVLGLLLMLAAIIALEFTCRLFY